MGIRKWQLYTTIGIASAGLTLNSSIAWACLPHLRQGDAPIYSKQNFNQWCKQRNSVNATAKATIETLLKSIGTQNCAEAQKRLQKTQRLISVQTLANEPQPANSLNIDAGETFDLAPVVAAAPHLRQINLVNTKIQNLATIKQFQQLSSLSLVASQITDVKPIGALKNLTYLDLSDNAIQDISALSPLVNLAALSLNRNQIEDISTIGSLQKLLELEVAGNRIRDLSVLVKLPELYHVNLRDNPIDTSTCSGKWADACEPDSTGQ
jgi:internalin A